MTRSQKIRQDAINMSVLEGKEKRKRLQEKLRNKQLKKKKEMEKITELRIVRESHNILKQQEEHLNSKKIASKPTVSVKEETKFSSSPPAKKKMSGLIDLTGETLTPYASSSYTLTVKTEHNLSSPPSTKKNAYIDLSSDTPQEATPNNRRLHAAAATAHVIDTKPLSFICSACAPIFGRFGIACAVDLNLI